MHACMHALLAERQHWLLAVHQPWISMWLKSRVHTGMPHVPHCIVQFYCENRKLELRSCSKQDRDIAGVKL